MSAQEFNLAMSKPILEAVVTLQKEAHDNWKIESTPSFVINDKTIISGDLSYEDFAAKINATDA